jgi:HlyD family secretion protein
MTRRGRLLGLAALVLAVAGGGYVALGGVAQPAAPAPAAAPAGPVAFGALGRVEPASRILRLSPGNSSRAPASAGCWWRRARW